MFRVVNERPDVAQLRRGRGWPESCAVSADGRAGAHRSLRLDLANDLASPEPELAAPDVLHHLSETVYADGQRQCRPSPHTHHLRQTTCRSYTSRCSPASRRSPLRPTLRSRSRLLPTTIRSTSSRDRSRRCRRGQDIVSADAIVFVEPVAHLTVFARRRRSAASQPKRPLRLVQATAAPSPSPRINIILAIADVLHARGPSVSARLSLAHIHALRNARWSPVRPFLSLSFPLLTSFSQRQASRRTSWSPSSV